MVVTFSGNRIMKTGKIMAKIIILILILCYILPQLLSLLWYIYYPEPKIREEHLLEKPLRVTINLLHIS
jgi:hypothetical protein